MRDGNHCDVGDNAANHRPDHTYEFVIEAIVRQERDRVVAKGHFADVSPGFRIPNSGQNDQRPTEVLSAVDGVVRWRVQLTRMLRPSMWRCTSVSRMRYDDPERTDARSPDLIMRYTVMVDTRIVTAASATVRYRARVSKCATWTPLLR